ncbi:hypothetical protein JWJ90_11415 [Desulfobulbus rhabdoformis]|uniref:hypothetical protein n=1 Tax=Desulfobulbus rhabdoformis TaxID=34032 RepID=UPI0019627EAA|nr:hypothetical protein [Desulfobulbus rhabdoformis]MBM9614892.1 hypothetical protein [Desulfobulbus rhabdoformis]
MIWIDLEHKLPTDSDIPEWTPWTREKWQAWMDKSQQLVDQLAAFDVPRQKEERNALINANSRHWGQLKEWLLALSSGKCWFSEVRELYSHYDVEHFRPKKVAKALDATERDGYWWLAFDYMNFRICGNVGNRKKGGWFPLQVGSHCSTYACQCEESESKYLLDPIDDYDVSLLAFDEEGKAVPVPGATEWEKQRVLETVKRLKFNEHVPLAEARRKIWQQVDGLVEDYLRTKARCGTGNNPAAQQKLRSVCEQIREKTQSRAELSAVAKWCILFRNDSSLSRLIY